MTRPTRVEPVKLIRFTLGWAIKASTILAASSGALETRLMAPRGRPAARNASTISAWVRGQFSEALNTTVLPQASGIATERTPRMIGAFHGAIERMTPTGWRMAKAVDPGRFDGITSPVICVVIDAA